MLSLDGSHTSGTEGQAPAPPTSLANGGVIQIAQSAAQPSYISTSAQMNTSLDIYWYANDRRNKNLFCETDKFGIPKFDGSKIRYRDFCNHVTVIKMRIALEKEDGTKIKILVDFWNKQEGTWKQRTTTRSWTERIPKT